MDVEDIRSDLTEVLITEEEIHAKLAAALRGALGRGGCVPTSAAPSS